MKREILFKAKRIDNGEWVVGDGIHYPKSYNWIGTCWVDGMQERVNDWIQVDPETVCEYTGLTDKNGVKIFEGDIIQMPHTREESYKIGENGMWKSEVIRKTDGRYTTCTGMGFRLAYGVEVIGNIHDNQKGAQNEAEA